MSTAGGGYVPDQQAIREGSKVLRREQVRNPKQFFTAPFSSIAMRASPRYPWRVQMTAAEKEDWLARTVDPVNGVFPGDELLFIVSGRQSKAALVLTWFNTRPFSHIPLRITRATSVSRCRRASPRLPAIPIGSP